MDLNIGGVGPDEGFTEADPNAEQPEEEADGEEDAGPMMPAEDSDDEEKIKKETPEERAERERELKEDLGGEAPFVFIDNLPKNAPDIVKLMKEVNRHIRELEEQFFYEEDSDAEERLYGMPKQAEGAGEDSDDSSKLVDPKAFTLPVEPHDKRLAQIRDRSNLQQFWCIPLCH